GAVKLFHLLAALLADLLVEVGAVPLCGRTAALLADLLVELRAMALRCGRATLSAGLRDGHRALALGHPGHSFMTPCAPAAFQPPDDPVWLQVPYRRSVGRPVSGQSPDTQGTICIRSVHRSGQSRASFVALERSSARPATYGP